MTRLFVFVRSTATENPSIVPISGGFARRPYEVIRPRVTRFSCTPRPGRRAVGRFISSFVSAGSTGPWRRDTNVGATRRASRAGDVYENRPRDNDQFRRRAAPGGGRGRPARDSASRHGNFRHDGDASMLFFFFPLPPRTHVSITGDKTPREHTSVIAVSPSAAWLAVVDAVHSSSWRPPGEPRRGSSGGDRVKNGRRTPFWLA